VEHAAAIPKWKGAREGHMVINMVRRNNHAYARTHARCCHMHRRVATAAV